MRKVIAGIAAAAVALALSACTGKFQSESYKQGYQMVHDMPAFNDHDRQQFRDASDGGMAAGGMCAMIAGSHKPASVGEFIQGCVQALAERGVK